MSPTETEKTTSQALWPWRPLYWEPSAGTGERLMVGVVYGFNGEFACARTLRDDVLTCLFGKAAPGLRRLIDHSLGLFEAAARASRDVSTVDAPMAGLYPGALRNTGAASATELLQTACLLYSSLANLDRLDEAEESDAPQQDEVNKRFGTEVRDEVAKARPELLLYFGKAGYLIPGGQLVRFGFFSPRAVIHFTVLSAVRPSASVRDARARLFELQRAREVAGIQRAALIAAVPRPDDATLGSKQRAQIKDNQAEIEHEADAVQMSWYAVHSAVEGAGRLLELA